MPRRRHVPVVLALLAFSACASRQAPRTAPAGTSVVSERDVRAHLEFLASDAMNGRGSGTRDEQIAAEYVGAQFRRLGLEPGGQDGSYVQTVDIVRQGLAAPPTIIVGDPSSPRLTWTHGKEFIGVPPAGVTSGPLQRLTASATVKPGAVVYVADDNFEIAARVAGSGAAVVLMKRTLTPDRWAAMAGRPLALPARIVGIRENTGRPAPVISLTAEAAAAMADVDEGTNIRLTATPAPSETGHTYNAVGILRGSNPSGDAILITSHLDHLGRRENARGADKIYNGADDDASGTVAVIEIAQALARRGTPKRTIIFASFGSEEAGGFGATYLRENPPVPLDRIAANVEFEMIGRPDPKVPPHTLWLTGYERSDLGAALAAHGARLVADPHPDQNFFRRSDNYTLALRGVVAHTVSSYNLHREYHTTADETRLVDYAHMTDAIGSMIEPLAWLANADFRPQWKPGLRP